MAGPETGLGGIFVLSIKWSLRPFRYGDSSKKVPKNGEHRSNAGTSAPRGLLLYVSFRISVIFFPRVGFHGRNCLRFSRIPKPHHTFWIQVFLFVIYDTSNTLRYHDLNRGLPKHHRRLDVSFVFCGGFALGLEHLVF
jgi:hypothetical protein